MAMDLIGEADKRQAKRKKEQESKSLRKREVEALERIAEALECIAARHGLIN